MVYSSIISLNDPKWPDCDCPCSKVSSGIQTVCFKIVAHFKLYNCMLFLFIKLTILFALCRYADAENGCFYHNETTLFSRSSVYNKIDKT